MFSFVFSSSGGEDDMSMPKSFSGVMLLLVMLVVNGLVWREQSISAITERERERERGGKSLEEQDETKEHENVERPEIGRAHV